MVVEKFEKDNKSKNKEIKYVQIFVNKSLLGYRIIQKNIYIII